MSQMQFNVRKFLKHLGGPTAIAAAHRRLLVPLGYKELKLNTISSWVREDTIRFTRLADLKHLARLLDIPWRFDEFFEEQ